MGAMTVEIPSEPAAVDSAADPLVRLQRKIACRADELARAARGAGGPIADLALWRTAEEEFLRHLDAEWFGATRARNS